MELTIDFETRSTVSLKNTNAWVYASHPSTEAFCLAFQVDDNDPQVWVNPYFLNILFMSSYCEQALSLPLASVEELTDNVFKANTIEAHNVEFERAIWSVVCANKYGFPPLPVDKLRCSAAKAASFALPRSLDGAAAALSLQQKKDDIGKELIKKLSVPRKPTKKNLNIWNEEPGLIFSFIKYCIQDVRAERALSKSMRDLSPYELRVWQLSQEINLRGMPIDVDSCGHAVAMCDYLSERANERINIISNGKLRSIKQSTAIVKFLQSIGIGINNLRADTVKYLLKLDALPLLPGIEYSKYNDDIAKEILQLRKDFSLSSISKYSAFLQRTSADGRLRSTSMYHGTTTGRDTGKGVQVLNLPRGSLKFYEAENAIANIRAGNIEELNKNFGGAASALKSCIRGMICAKNGYDLIAADYSSIEGMVLAWLAGEDYIVENYVQGKDAYCVFAAQINPEYTYDQIYNGKKAGDKKFVDLRQNDGKPGELACGYGGGQRAVLNFAPNLPLKRRKEIVSIWRKHRPKTVTFWSEMENRAKEAIRTGRLIHWNNITWGMHGKFLHCKLPSGRLLSYYSPSLRIKDSPCNHLDDETCPYGIIDPPECGAMSGKYCRGYVGFKSETISFLGMKKKWGRQYTYGGKLVENIVQAASRDIMVNGMLNAEHAGYKIILTVYDEIVAEVPEGFGSVEEFCSLITALPPWAYGVPVRADGWRGKRYRKD